MLFIGVSNAVICPHGISRCTDADQLSACSWSWLVLGWGCRAWTWAWSHLTSSTWKLTVLSVTWPLWAVRIVYPHRTWEGWMRCAHAVAWALVTTRWASLQQDWKQPKGPAVRNEVNRAVTHCVNQDVPDCCSNKLPASQPPICHRPTGAPSALYSSLGTHANRSPAGYVFPWPRREGKDHSELPSDKCYSLSVTITMAREAAWVWMDESI